MIYARNLLQAMVLHLKNTANLFSSGTAKYFNVSHTRETQYLSCESIKQLGDDLTLYLKHTGDPLPRYDIYDAAKIASIIDAPQRMFDKRELYTSVYDKAACYFYFFIKLHPFLDGNKRMAVFASFVFLEINGYAVIAEFDAVYNFAYTIAKSHNAQDQEFADVVTFLRQIAKSI